MSLDTDAAGLMIAQSDAPGDYGLAEIGRIAKVCEESGATTVFTSGDRLESEMLVAARRFAYPALRRLGTTMLDDVAVPRERIAEFIGRIESIGRLARRQGVTIGTFGHAGDGNLHPTIIFDRTSPSSTVAAKTAFNDVIEAGLELGGTVTGEHGVGNIKRDQLAGELGPAVLNLHRRIKHALDPGGVMNPGKVLLEDGAD